MHKQVLALKYKCKVRNAETKLFKHS